MARRICVAVFVALIAFAGIRAVFGESAQNTEEIFDSLKNYDQLNQFRYVLDALQRGEDSERTFERISSNKDDAAKTAHGRKLLAPSGSSFYYEYKIFKQNEAIKQAAAKWMSKHPGSKMRDFKNSKGYKPFNKKLMVYSRKKGMAEEREYDAHKRGHPHPIAFGTKKNKQYPPAEFADVILQGGGWDKETRHRFRYGKPLRQQQQDAQQAPPQQFAPVQVRNANRRGNILAGQRAMQPRQMRRARSAQFLQRQRSNDRRRSVEF
mmetsp:Transcript_10127/g.16611  ORF Transcript_10127/g.16611 Transcript_10127/m.16611 type:complete len:265 (-) Transcript_10127:113-907(-)